jgi:uncharacterized protein (DUF362 family)
MKANPEHLWRWNDEHEEPSSPGAEVSWWDVKPASFSETGDSGGGADGGGSGTGACPGGAADSSDSARAVTCISRCKRYDYPLVRENLARMFDQLGDVRQLVKNRFVTVKVNLVNAPDHEVGGVPLYMTVTVHPNVAMALGSLLVEYGAKQVTYCDQLPLRIDDREAFSLYGFDIPEMQRQMDGRARFANTRNKGSFKDYALVKVPGGGFLASAWEVNRTYTDCDVLISLGKMKSHVSGGVTLGMKNLFGVPPSSMYGDDLKDHPDEDAAGYRGATMHDCTKKPLTSVETYKGTSSEGDHGYNVPHFIVDLNAAFPIDLTVIDGISTIRSGEGWWIGSSVDLCSPGLLIAGRNPVCTDSVGTACMGFDPEVPDRVQPFINGTNYLTWHAGWAWAKIV